MTGDAGRERVLGIQTESVITVDGDCYLSGSYLGEELKFMFGPVHNGLMLYFTWDGLAKFLGVLATMIARIGDPPPDNAAEISVSADEQSRLAHGPNIGPAATLDGSRSPAIRDGRDG